MKKLVPVAFVVMALAFIYLRFAAFRPKMARLNIGSATIEVEIADTVGKRTRGLSGRDELAPDQGMLFPLGEPGIYTFWMKEMRFPLDFIWIRDGRVVDITEDVPHPVGERTPQRVQPSEPASAVLEVNADFSEQYGIEIGETVEVKI